MNKIDVNRVDSVIEGLYKEAKFDPIKVMKNVTKAAFRPLLPDDFSNAFLAISKEQGEHLTELIITNELRNIVEFGTSFGISTLFLAKGVSVTGGKITTTELIESKAAKAEENFVKAGVQDLIDIKVGDALDTLSNYQSPIDFLLLDGWKDLYLPLFELLEPKFQSNVIIYVDNADMKECQIFLSHLASMERYDQEVLFGGKAVLLRPTQIGAR